MTFPTTMVVPADTAAVVLLRANGTNVEAQHLEVVEGIPLPRRQTALALRMLADVLEAQAAEADA